MNKKEFDKICEIIDKLTTENWVTPYYCKKYIPSENIPEIKNQISDLVK